MKQEIRKNAEQEKQEEEKQEKQQKESQKRNKEKNGMKRKRASPSTSRSVVRDAKPFKCSECGKPSILIKINNNSSRFNNNIFNSV